MIYRYNDFTKYKLLEKYDDHLKDELNKMGIMDEEEVKAHLYQAHRGNLGAYLNEKGQIFTFGLLRAIFEDALEAKRRTDLKIGAIKMVHRLIPIVLAKFYPIIAIIGYILGTSRAFNKVIAPILADPGNTFPSFLKKIIDANMRIAEGDYREKDRFFRAFKVDDRLVDTIKPEILKEFSIFLSRKMAMMNMNLEVPDNFIEDELRLYLNKEYNISPKLSIKESFLDTIKYNPSPYTSVSMKEVEVSDKSLIQDIDMILLDIRDLGYSANVEYNSTPYGKMMQQIILIKCDRGRQRVIGKNNSKNDKEILEVFLRIKDMLYEEEWHTKEYWLNMPCYVCEDPNASPYDCKLPFAVITAKFLKSTNFG